MDISSGFFIAPDPHENRAGAPQRRRQVVDVITVMSFGRKIPVVIIEYYVEGNEHFAKVQALEGKPFVSLDRWPVQSAFKVVKVSDLWIEQAETLTRR